MTTEKQFRGSGDKDKVLALVAEIEQLHEAEQAEVMGRVVAGKLARTQSEPGAFVAFEVLRDDLLGIPCEDEKARRARQALVTTAARLALGRGVTEANEAATLRRIALGVFEWSAARNPMPSCVEEAEEQATHLWAINRAEAFLGGLGLACDVECIAELLDKPVSLERKTAELAVALGVRKGGATVEEMRSAVRSALAGVVLR